MLIFEYSGKLYSIDVDKLKGLGNIFICALSFSGDPIASSLSTPVTSELLMDTESNSTVPETACKILNRVHVPCGAIAEALYVFQSVVRLNVVVWGFSRVQISCP